MKYIVLGPEGTFTDLAFQHFKSDQDQVTYEDSIEKVLRHLEQHDYAIIPIENTLEGYIQPSLDGLIKHRLYVIDQVQLAIDFSLIGHSTSLQDIKNLYVQFAAKGQCQKLIETLDHVKIHVTDNNITGYLQMKKQHVGDAAIIPSHMVNESDQVIYHHVADTSDNWTRFILVGKKEEYHLTKDMRISLVVTPKKDRPGLLYDLLGVFKKRNINLTSIMSRPTKSKMGHYHFYIDLIAKDMQIDHILHVIDTLKNEGEVFIYGIYPHREPSEV